MEKALSYAARGALPFYDTRDALLRMTAEIDRFDPAAIVCLGDSFHDLGAWARMHREDAARSRRLRTGGVGITTRRCRRRAGRGGRRACGRRPRAPASGLEGAAVEGEIFGYFHPKVSVHARGKVVVRRAFLEDGRRLVMPARLCRRVDAGDPALRALFPRGCLAHVLGRTRVFSLSCGRQ
ncbi:MAG: phosphoesterase [Alphaproteobacteria bacterium]